MSRPGNNNNNEEENAQDTLYGVGPAGHDVYVNKPNPTFGFRGEPSKCQLVQEVLLRIGGNRVNDTPNPLEARFASVFGDVLQLYNRPFKFHGKVIQYLFYHTIYPNVENELQFRFGQSTVKFGIREFVLMTGLRCGVIHELPANTTSMCFTNTSPFIAHSIDKGPIKNSDLERWLAMIDQPAEVLYRVVLVYFIHAVMLGNSENVSVPLGTFLLVDDMERVANFPWGSWLWNLTYRHICKTINFYKAHENPSRLHVYGMMQAIQTFGYEVLTGITSFGRTSAGSLTHPDAVPRMLRWTCNKIAPKWFQVEPNADNGQVVSHLVFREVDRVLCANRGLSEEVMNEAARVIPLPEANRNVPSTSQGGQLQGSQFPRPIEEQPQPSTMPSSSEQHHIPETSCMDHAAAGQSEHVDTERVRRLEARIDGFDTDIRHIRLTLDQHGNQLNRIERLLEQILARDQTNQSREGGAETGAHDVTPNISCQLFIPPHILSHPSDVTSGGAAAVAHDVTPNISRQLFTPPPILSHPPDVTGANDSDFDDLQNIISDSIILDLRSMATKEISIKLMIDPKSNGLIFAEASKDFVDFLIYLLSLPIATATDLLSDGSMVGSIGNVYASVSNLDETYLRPNVNKNVILSPMFFPSAIKTPLSVAGSSINKSMKFYTCVEPTCKRFITNIPSGTRCSYCRKDMNNEIKFIDEDSDGFVQSAGSYMISDDLSISSISTMSIVSMLNKFKVTTPEERVVKIGNEEALELLKASLQSTTVLTDVFLKSKKRKQPGNAHVTPCG